MEKCDKRELIVQAALELVAEQGFHGAPMALIADKAGVGAGTIYRYFENKDALIKAIYQIVEERVVRAIMEGYPENAPVRERFMHFGKVLVKYLVDAPLELRFVEQFHNSPFGVDHRREKIFGKREKDIIRVLFEEAIQQQIFKELPLPILYSLLFAPLIDVCRDQILGFIELNDSIIEQTISACWDAVRR